MEERYSDAMLMAYADGELTAEQRAEIDQALRQDASLAARLAVFAKTRTIASDAFEPLLEAPVPAALKDSIADLVARHDETANAAPESGPAPETTAGAGDTVVPLARNQTTRNANGRRSNARKPSFLGVRLDYALAASLMLAAGGVIGYLVATAGAPAPSGGILAAGIDNPAIATALRTVPSGDELTLEDGTRFRAIASFNDDADSLCREFEVDTADRSTIVSVACAADEAWRLRFVVVAGAPDAAFAPASSLEALDAYLSAIGAGAPLSAEAEQAALDGLR